MTSERLLNHRVMFLFVVIMVYLLMSRFMLLLNFYYMFHVLFAIKVPCQRDTKIKDVYTVKALETVEVKLFNLLVLLKL